MSDAPGLTHYVSLDLGSESMAAFCQDMTSGEGCLVTLQDLGLVKPLIEVKLNSNVTDAQVELFRDEENKSFRLRTRIALEESKQPDILQTSHATLDFLGNGHQSYKDSLFRYFHTTGQALRTKLLPNPKIITQYSAQPILPELRTNNGQRVQYPPKELLQHLITQVVRNFIKHGLTKLDSRQITRLPEALANVHLVLTVPNVYSDRLVKELKSFLEANAGVGAVSIVYESDAVAYYLRRHECKGKYKLYDVFSDPVRGADLRIMTFDMGRGTTDLSFIQLLQPTDNSSPLPDKVLGWLSKIRFFGRLFGEPAGQAEAEAVRYENHTMLARTGKSDGGNKLTYIFATYFNERLQKLFNKHNATLEWNFLSATGGADLTADHAEALGTLEQLVEEVKKSFTNSYSIKLSFEQQAPHLRRILELAAQRASSVEVNDENIKFMALPSLPWLAPWEAKEPVPPRKPEKEAKKKPGSKRADLVKLKRAVKGYVNENVGELIEELLTMAKRMEDSQGNVIDTSRTFVVVAGRGSHFAPVRTAIQKSCDGLSLKGNVDFLEGDDAKYACCKGAVMYAVSQSRHQALNRDEMFGTYGFLASGAATEMFKAVDMNVARTDANGAEVKFAAVRKYYFVWTKRPVADDTPTEKLPTPYDGRTVSLGQFEGDRFKVRYSGTDIYVSVYDGNAWGTETKVGEPKSFADVKEIDPIYEKLWPEALRPIS